MAGCCCAEACTAAVFIGVMRLPGCPFGSAWCLVCEVCRLRSIGLIVCVSCILCSSAVPGVWSFLRVTHQLPSLRHLVQQHQVLSPLPTHSSLPGYEPNFAMIKPHNCFEQCNTTFPLLLFHRTPWKEVTLLWNVAGTSMHAMYVTLEVCASICPKHR